MSTAYGNPSAACSFGSADYFVYSAENGPLGVTRFYSDTSLTVGFVGGNYYYKWSIPGDTSVGYIAQIDDDGFVTSIVDICIGGYLV